MTSGEPKAGLGFCIATVILSGATIVWITLPPRGDGSAPAGSGRRTEAPPFEIRIVHDDKPCADHRARKPCRQESDWSVQWDGRSGVDLEDLRSALRREADRARSDLRDPSTSERHVVIRGPETAPWGLVQRFMNEAAKVGIHKIDWTILEREKGSPSVPAWLPTRKTSSLNEIRVFMKWDPNPGMALRKVGNRGMVDSDEDLMNIILQMVRDYRDAGIGSAPILIDAAPDVPWRDVLHVLELCRKEGLESIEFAAPFYQKH